ncbi:MAG: hypothetical protein OEY28_00095 [Nitrospira sp.]|nr:hypothetical protein [Nitrospira sp.]
MNVDVLNANDKTEIERFGIQRKTKLRQDADQRFTELVGRNRSDAIGEVAELVRDNGRTLRPLAYQRKLKIATGGGNYVDFTLDASQLKLLQDTNDVQQPANAVQVIEHLTVFLGSEVKKDTMQELADKLDIVVEYPDSRKDWRLPLAKLLATRVKNAVAGNNAGAPIEGVDSSIEPTGNRLDLPPGHQIVVFPGDKPVIRLAWNTDYAAAAPAAPAGADAADVNLIWLVEGEEYIKVNS